ncbi:MAG TPA: hypothetical protein VNI77_04950 [Nitrososphaera sp.]|nr:hypothetical protein [Nitrososphaera sp.]
MSGRFLHGWGGITLKSIEIAFVLLRLVITIFVSLFLMLIVFTSVTGYADAQSIPLPPPSPQSSEEEVRIAENDTTPPKIEVLTTELIAGKNVFRVRITDDSSLQVREVKYVRDGQIRIDGLFRDRDDIYKALVDIQPPSRVIVVTASDANGNIATTFKEYDIKESNDLISQITNMLSQIPRYLQEVFGSIIPTKYIAVIKWQPLYKFV